jgi:lia operon protein LiaG
MRHLMSLAFILIPLTALAAQQPERYTVDGDDVAVYNLAGLLQVEAGQGAVTVLVARGGTDAARLKVANDEIDGRQSLRVIYPADRIRYSLGKGDGRTELRVRDDGTFGDNDEWDGKDHHEHHHDGWHDGRRVTIATGTDGLDAHADLTVQIPAGRRVALYIAVGRVTVTNVSGELRIDASSSPVNATGVKGSLMIDVGSGDVQVAQVDGDLTVDTGSGSVKVSQVKSGHLSIDTGSGDVSGSDLQGEETSVETGSGEITITSLRSPKVSLETGSGGVTANLQDQIRELQIETGSGDVAIKAPPTLGAELEIETSNGEIETDFPLQVTRQGRDHLTGRIGDGKGRIAIETGSGAIKFLKASS